MELITVGNTTLEKEWIALPQLFGEVQAVLTPMMEKSGISLQAHPIAGMIWIDQELFKSLLYNLIDNAVKASAIGNVVILEAKRLAGIRCLFDCGSWNWDERGRNSAGCSAVLHGGQIPHPQAWRSRSWFGSLCRDCEAAWWRTFHGQSAGRGTTVSWEMEGKDL